MSNIPNPPHRPHYAEYAAGAPGDSRPLETRLAERIAREDLLVPTLETRGRDSLDFHDLNAAALGRALERAFKAGRACGRDDLALRFAAATKLARYVARHGNVTKEARLLCGFILAEDPEDAASVRQALDEAIAAGREELHDGFGG